MSELDVTNAASEGRSISEIRRAPLVVQDDVTFLFDTARFEQLQRLAGVMAACRTMPAHLKGSISDCFRVASQAMRWQMDPFSICDKTYEVGGKLAYEGQLIAAVVNLRAGVEGRLSYRYSGDPTQPETLSITVAAKFRGEAEERTIEATWKAGFAMSKGAKDKWQSQPEQQLSYFGARVWARRHCPEIILGAYTPEELFDDQQIASLRDVTPRAGGKLDALESLANPEGHREGNDATTAYKSHAAPEDAEDAFGLKPLSKEAEDQMREWARIRTELSNSPPAQQQERSATDGLGGPAPGGEPDQSASRPTWSTAAGHPGADAKLPADPGAPVEDASRRGDGHELGQSLGAVTDERLTGFSPALGNRENAANVSDRPQSDLLGGPPADNLAVPVPRGPTPGQLDYVARQLLALINEEPRTVQRLAQIKLQNEPAMAALKKGATAQYDEVQAALARRVA